MDSVKYKALKLTGETGKLAEKITDNWLMGIRESNPAIIDMFRDRDLLPYRDMLPWSGEFAGKYITGAAFVYKLTGRQDLYGYVTDFIDELLTYQDGDGYIGCFAKQCHLSGAFSQSPEKTGETWDAWAHYHIMYGLVMWYEITGRRQYLAAAEKAAGLFIRKFYNGRPPLVSIGWSETNLAVYHIFGILYEKTKKPEYLDFARNIEKDLESDAAGNYINNALSGCEYYLTPKPRWESMHIIMGIAQMYRCTGEKKYLDAACQIFFSILKTDVHNTGGFSTDEQATGNPYKNGAIETCCVVAYNALAIEIYKLTGDLRAADFLERSHYNAVLGYCSPSGRWSTYNTPMEGVKCANFHSIWFQCRPGSPELNCCSVNAPRGVADLCEWIIRETEDTVFLNFYESMHVETESGFAADIKGDYPACGRVNITVTENKCKKKLALRIPAWSKRTSVQTGNDTYRPAAGEYFITDAPTGNITVTFDFTPYTEAGGGEYGGKCSIYAGPVLYAYDLAANRDFDFDSIPPVPENELKAAVPVREKDGRINLRFSNGVTLTNFGRAGDSGTSYKTWLSVE